MWYSSGLTSCRYYVREVRGKPEVSEVISAEAVGEKTKDHKGW